MEGIILVDKPEGWTSFDVCNYIRRMIRDITKVNHENRGFCTDMQGVAWTRIEMSDTEDASSGPSRTKSTVTGATEQSDKVSRSKVPEESGSARLSGYRCVCKIKVGHTGTLDPAATGLLMICVGKATKRVPELIKQDKTYEVELTLGKTSTTGDKEGKITTNSTAIPELEAVMEVISSFVGEIGQTPPIYSAIKINGKKAYDLARAGKEVVMVPRKVTIYSIDEVTYDYPKVTFTTRVGSGTYIRSLATDIGEKLGTGAYTSNLRRTSIGDATIRESYAVSDITPELLKSTLK